MGTFEVMGKAMDTVTNIVYLLVLLLLFVHLGIVSVGELVYLLSGLLDDASWLWVPVGLLLAVAIAYAGHGVQLVFRRFVRIRRGDLLATYIGPLRQVLSLVAAVGLLKFVYLLWQSPHAMSGESWMHLAGEFISAL